MFKLTDYSYHLPRELIAQEAAHPHHDARLMVVDRQSGDIETEDTFWNLDHSIPENRVIFFNNSKVLHSRIPLENIEYAKQDGTPWILKEGEIFFLETSGDDTFEALVRPGDKFRIGTTFTVGNSKITVLERTDTGRVLQIQGDSIFHLMEQFGNLPLPPYIAYDKSKEKDYQTSFAEKEGSVAAPTASLHFTRELLEKIPNEKKYITLHVGLGTFKGIDTSDIREYVIHRETAEIEMSLFALIAKLKSEGKKVVAVGTTVCRTLESLPYVWKNITQESRETLDKETINYWNHLTKNLEPKNWIHNTIFNFASWILNFSTSIYITPGHEFLVVDDLITNFHLPESSLLVLVSAFLGQRETMKLYEKAIQNQYRFYSFWDGMYIRWK